MKLGLLADGRIIVVPEHDLEERLVLALMAALADDPGERTTLTENAIHVGDGLFTAYNPDRFYWLEQVSGGGGFVLLSAEE